MTYAIRVMLTPNPYSGMLEVLGVSDFSMRICQKSATKPVTGVLKHNEAIPGIA